MASSPKTTVTFADLPREVRDNIYKHMLTEPRTINVCKTGVDYGQPEDFGTLRAMLNAWRTSPQFAGEAFELFFRINTIRIKADPHMPFLNRPVHYVKGRGFQPLMMFVQVIELGVSIYCNDPYKLSGCFRKLLACPVLSRVMVEVAPGADWWDKGNSTPNSHHVNKKGLKTLDITLTATTEMFLELKKKMGEGLTFETTFPAVGEMIKAWEEGITSETTLPTVGETIKAWEESMSKATIEST